jgi:hypothetical protein
MKPIDLQELRNGIKAVQGAAPLDLILIISCEIS